MVSFTMPSYKYRSAVHTYDKKLLTTYRWHIDYRRILFKRLHSPSKWTPLNIVNAVSLIFNERKNINNFRKIFRIWYCILTKSNVSFWIFRQYILTNVRNKRKIKNSKNSNLISACRVSMTWRLYKMMKDDEWSWSAYKMFIFFSVELFLDK